MKIRIHKLKNIANILIFSITEAKTLDVRKSRDKACSLFLFHLRGENIGLEARP
jgi:hypothetical protein